MTGPLYVFLIAGTLGALWGIAGSLQPIPRILVYSQVVYWGLSYVLRPVVLLVVRPPGAANDSIADPRLARDDYQGLLTADLRLVFAGLIAYFVAVLMLRRHLHRFDARLDDLATALQPRASLLGIAWVAGWLARGAQLIVQSNSFFELVGNLASGAAFLLLALYKPRTRLGSGVLIGGLATGELLWSFVDASKTPIMAALLAVVLRLAGRRLDARSIIRYLAIGVGALLAFMGVQSLKTQGETSTDLALVTATYPAAARPLLPVVRRFDLLSAVTDAVSAGPSTWLQGSGFGQMMLTQLVPQQLQSTQKPLLGQLWAAQVRGVSVPGSNSTVSLASGFIAEGWVTGGIVGVVLEASCLGALLLLISRSLNSGRLGLMFFSALMLSEPLLFERGILGATATGVKAVEATFIAILLSVFVSPLGPKSSRGRSVGGAVRRIRMPLDA